jgi:hypothetical protein
VLTRNFRDRVLIWVGVTIVILSFALAFFGYGKFWVPEFLVRLAGG